MFELFQELEEKLEEVIILVSEAHTIVGCLLDAIEEIQINLDTKKKNESWMVKPFQQI